MKTIFKKIMNFITRISLKCLVFLQKLATFVKKTHVHIQIIAFSVVAGILFLIVLSLVVQPNVKRSLFFFHEARTKTIRMEVRYLPKTKTLDSRLDQFVDELLLGPIDSRYTPIYNTKTRVLRCFVRNKVAFIDISSDALQIAEGPFSSAENFSLFKKNVFTNFRNLDKIYLYIDGIQVYSEKPIGDDQLKK